MKVNIEMENLSEIVEKSLENNISATVNDIIENKVKDEINAKYSKTIEQIVNEKMAEYVTNYIKTATITVGGGFDTKNNPVTTYTVEEYINKQIGEIFNKEAFTIEEKNRYGDYSKREVSFSTFIKSSFDVNAAIKSQLETFITSAKKDINAQMKECFDSTTKTMLSETVFNMLMQSDTYSKISNGLKLLEGK